MREKNDSSLSYYLWAPQNRPSTRTIYDQFYLMEAKRLRRTIKRNCLHLKKRVLRRILCGPIVKNEDYISKKPNMFIKKVKSRLNKPKARYKVI